MKFGHRWNPSIAPQEVIWLPVARLWEANKDTFWELGDDCQEVTLAEMSDTYRSGDLDIVFHDAQDDLERHLDTIGFWERQFIDYVGNESDLPPHWALDVLEDDEVEDGNHRLVAAVEVGLSSFPCIIKDTQENPISKSVLFVDLDETLVRTTYLENARELFVPGVTFPLSALPEQTKQELRQFSQLTAPLRDKKPLSQENFDELSRWARSRDIILVEFAELDYPMVTMLRPGANKLLSAGKRLFNEVNLLTTGREDFQSEILRLVGIDHYFDNVYGRETLGNAPGMYGEPPLTDADFTVLIDDNNSYGSTGWHGKMVAINAISDSDYRKIRDLDYTEQDAAFDEIAKERFIHAPVWQGKPDDIQLFVLTEKLEHLVKRVSEGA